MKSVAGVVLTLVFLASGPLCRAGELDATVAECNDCHGPDGVSAHDDVPTIAGFSSFTLSDYLLTYQEGARPCPASKYRHGDTSRAERDMCDIAKGLSEDEITAIADCYAAKPFVTAKQPADPAKAEAGQALHQTSCEKCHTDGGTNPAEDASILAGQWMPYLRRSFEEFKSGERGQPENMKAKLDALGADEIEALVHYYGSRQ